MRCGRLIALLGVAFALALALPGVAHAQLIVSLTFDDGVADQQTALPILARHGMKATFFVNSARLGHTGYLTLSQVRAMQAAGHEIGGHTADHANLPALDAAGRQRQICGDRAALLADGLAISDFAYPFGGEDPEVQAVVAGCGYDSARLASGIVSPTSCGGCPASNPIPPENIDAIRAIDSFEATSDLVVAEDQVRAAQAAGGWLPLTFHHICDGCNEYGVSAAWFSALLDFLAAQPDITVARVSDVIGGAVQPPVPAATLTTTSPAQLLQNGALEILGTDGVPSCFEQGGTGDATAAWYQVRGYGDSGTAEQVHITRLPAHSDAKLISRRDSGICAPRVSPKARYVATARYRTRQEARMVAYARDGDGTWNYFAQSPLLKPGHSWRRARWKLPSLPAGATALSIGVSLRAKGILAVDDLRLTQLTSSRGR
jgi:peptidoglycan/xylan/chitin deacetylase (PgdA/CDA1 family)